MFVKQTDPEPLTTLERLLDLWSTISVIIYAGSAVLVVCLLIIIVVYAVHQKYVQHALCTAELFNLGVEICLKLVGN